MSESKGDNKTLELFDMKQEIMGNNYKLRIVDKTVNTLAVNLKKTEIVQKEISNLSDDTKIYDRCGRIFVISNKENVLDKLQINSKKLAIDLEKQKEVKKKIEETVTEQTKQFNELALGLNK